MDRSLPATDKGQRAYLLLKKALLLYRFPPRQRLSVREIAKLVGTSPTPAREALTRLADEGLVILHPRLGYFSRLIDIDTVRDDYELAYILLRYATVRGCPDFSDEGFSPALRWTEEDESMQIADRLARRAARDLERLYGRIAGLAGNRRVMQSVAGFIERTQYVREVDLERPGRRHGALLTAGYLIEGLCSGDVVKATAALEAHFTLGESMLAELVCEANARWISRTSPGLHPI